MDVTRWAFSPDIPDWPADAKGQKERAVLLRHTFDNPVDVDMTISLLSAYGIPCFPFYPGEGGTGKVINGFSGFGTALYVPESMLDDAAALLAAKPIENETEEDA